MTRLESIIDGMDEKERESYKHWYQMYRSAYEIGLSAQRVLLKHGVMLPRERLFLTRDERRQLTE